MSKIDELLESTRRLSEERTFLLEVLALWQHAEKAGFPANLIKAFTFRPQFLSRAECKKMKRHYGSNLPCLTYFNCARLKSGDLVEIPLYPRPQKV
jgi:hypothetical protein